MEAAGDGEVGDGAPARIGRSAPTGSLKGGGGLDWERIPRKAPVKVNSPIPLLPPVQENILKQMRFRLNAQAVPSPTAHRKRSFSGRLQRHFRA